MKNFWNSLRVNFSFRRMPHLFPFLLPLLLLFTQGCKKDITSIGLNLRDDLLNAAFSDSISLSAYSILEDTLNTTNLVSNYLGFLKDDIFGTTTTGLYTQFLPSSNSVNFGSNPQLDSVVLTLKYSGGFYGDTLNPFTIKVYELTEKIEDSKTYHQTDEISYKTQNLTFTDFNLYPKPTTKVPADSLLTSHIRIRLTDKFGKNFLDNPKMMNSSDVFKNFFKGLYISAEPLLNKGSLVNFDLNSAISGIQLYYKQDTVARRFTLVTNNQNIVRFSHYKHDYTLGENNFKQQVLNNETDLGKNILYVQSMGGIKTKITFPYIKAFKDKRMVINKAELVISIFDTDLTLFPPPARLFLTGINSSGVNVRIPDEDIFASAAYFGGTYDAAKKEYRFRVTRYIQDIILRNNFEPSIYLVVNGAAANAYRLILNGTAPQDLSKRLRLEIYYTEY